MEERAATIPEALVRERRRLPPYLELWVRLVREKPLGMIGAVLVLALLVTAIFADFIAPYGYNEPSFADQLASPSRKFLFGADQFGRDVLSRVIYGARVSIYVGFGTVGMSIVLATLLGVVSGYFGGWIDTIIQRVVDLWMSFPMLVVLLTIISLTGTGMVQVIVSMAFLFSFRNSRIIRGTVMSLKENMYIEAAKSIGSRAPRIISNHILPNAMAPIIIIATTELGTIILIEASLSFLGYGIPPPTPSWGQMLSSLHGRQYMLQAPWMAIWPGVALSMAVFGWNMFGDALRDLLDPRLRGTAGRFR